MRALDERTQPNSCINKADDNEPVFVLRANDDLAADTVRYWVSIALQRKLHDDKIAEAQSIADAMETWNSKKVR